MIDLVPTLVTAALACSAAILLALATRTPIRRHCGAQSAYAAWALVPLASIATLLPSQLRIVTLHSTPIASGSVDLLSEGGASIAAVIGTEPFAIQPWLVGVWAIGVVVSLTFLLWQQHRFVSSLGRLQAMSGDVRRAETTAGCPALVGLWRPRIVVPVDFEQRYDRLERDLILAHERHHRSRGDAQINMLAASLRSVFWFNPLVHFAAAHFLVDQELACDAAVMTRFPNSRRAYARAMLKTQLAHFGLPLGCQWRSQSAIRERVVMLKRSAIGPRRRWLGAGIAGALILSGSYAAWAVQPATTELRYVDASNGAAGHASDRGDAIESSGATAVSATAVHTSPTDVRSDETSNGTLPSRLQQPLETTAHPTRIPRHDSAFAGIAKPGAGRGVATAAQEVRPSNIVDNAEPGVVRSPPIVSAPTSNGDVETGGNHDPEEIASYRRTFPPRYPAAAARGHIEGKVVLDVHVDDRGKPTSAHVASLTPTTATELASASIAAVMQWQFSPAVRTNGCVAGNVAVPFIFALEGDASHVSSEPRRQASYRGLSAIAYPQTQADMEGVIYLKLRVEKDGSISSANIDRIDPATATPLGTLALNAVKTWTFSPARNRGSDIASTVTVPIVFSSDPQSHVAFARTRDGLDPIRVTPNG